VTELRDLYGTWRLRSYYLENVDTAERTEVFGANPNGVLIFLPEGRMAAIITPGEQAKPLTEADEAWSFQNLVAYSGVFRLEPPDRFVTSVDVAWFAPWRGSDQPRRFVLQGDTLDIISDPTELPPTGDEPVRGVLSWSREHTVGR